MPKRRKIEWLTSIENRDKKGYNHQPTSIHIAKPHALNVVGDLKKVSINCMRIIVLSTVVLLIGQIALGQVNDGLIELGKSYRQFMFRNNPPENVLNSLDKLMQSLFKSKRPGSNILPNKF